MAMIYNKKTKKVYWQAAPLEFELNEAFLELSEVLAGKRLDGHDIEDQWYMAVHSKMNELIELFNKNPNKPEGWAWEEEEIL